MNMIRFNQPALSVMDQLFNNTMCESNGCSSFTNIYETENAFVIEVNAPGYTKEDFKINLEQQTLKISAESNEEGIPDEKFLRREFTVKNINRSFVLPKSVDIDNIIADYQNGILKVTLPRKEESLVKKEITIN